MQKIWHFLRLYGKLCLNMGVQINSISGNYMVFREKKYYINVENIKIDYDKKQIEFYIEDIRYTINFKDGYIEEQRHN